MNTEEAFRHSVDIQKWIDETLQKLGCFGSFRLHWEWNESFIRRMGDAARMPPLKITVKPLERFRVRFSTPLWPRASAEDRRETVIHEVCHVVDMWRSLSDPTWQRDGKHGASWRKLMRECGVEPKRCHSVDRTGLPGVRRAPRTQVYCGCPNGLTLAPIQYGKLQRGAKYRCRKCKQHLRLSPPMAASEPASMKMNCYRYRMQFVCGGCGDVLLSKPVLVSDAGITTTPVRFSGCACESTDLKVSLERTNESFMVVEDPPAPPTSLTELGPVEKF